MLFSVDVQSHPDLRYFEEWNKNYVRFSFCPLSTVSQVQSHAIGCKSKSSHMSFVESPRQDTSQGQ